MHGRDGGRKGLGSQMPVGTGRKAPAKRNELNGLGKPLPPHLWPFHWGRTDGVAFGMLWVRAPYADRPALLDCTIPPWGTALQVPEPVSTWYRG